MESTVALRLIVSLLPDVSDRPKPADPLSPWGGPGGARAAGRPVLGDRDVGGDAGESVLVEHAQKAGHAVGRRHIGGREHAAIYKGQLGARDLTPLPAHVAPEAPVVIVITGRVFEVNRASSQIQIARQLS